MASKKSFDSNDLVVKYALEHSSKLHPVQEKLREVTMKHEHGGMMGAPEITHLLMNLIKLMNGKKIIEVGVFTGFSTLGFALSIPSDGKVVGCDVEEEFVNVGKPFWKEAGVDKKIDVIIQSATKTLDQLIENGESGTYDMAFIEADKESYHFYIEKCLQLIRKGGFIAIDNVLRGGSVVDGNSTRQGTKEIHACNEKLKNDPRVDVNFLVIGDGLTLAFKK